MSERAVEDEVLRHLRDDAEIEISTTTADGERRSVTIWAVAAEGVPYIRSVRGTRGAWYRRATARDRNGVELGGRVHPVALLPTSDEAELAAVDAALRAKYERRWPSETASMLTAEARACTLRVERV